MLRENDIGRSSASSAALVREVIGEILPYLAESEIEGHRTLKDLGADSVDRIEIIAGLIARLGVPEPMMRFSGLHTVDELVNFIDSRRQGL